MGQLRVQKSINSHCFGSLVIGAAEQLIAADSRISTLLMYVECALAAEFER